MRLEIDTEASMLTFDGVDVSLEVFAGVFIHPNPRKFYRFQRMLNNSITIHAYYCENGAAELATVLEETEQDEGVQDLPER
jgi:hypothetical protein